MIHWLAPTTPGLMKSDTPVQCSPDAELAVLGSCLMSARAVDFAVTRLQPGDFYFRNHQVVFACIQQLNSRGGGVDPLTLEETLKSNRLFEKVGGVEFLLRITNATPTAQHVDHYCTIVLNLSKIRQVQMICQEIGHLAPQSVEDPDALLVDLTDRVADLSVRGKQTSVQPLESLVLDLYERITVLAQNPTGPVTGVPFGIDNLDFLLGGWQNKLLYIIAGRPSMGKTAFGVSAAVHAAKHLKSTESKGKIMFFSLEMPAEEITGRMVSCAGTVHPQFLRTGQERNTNWDVAAASIADVSDYPIVIADPIGASVNDIRLLIRDQQRAGEVALVIVDYLQMIRPPGNSRQTREREITLTCEHLKEACRALDVPIIALAQIGRSAEQRRDCRPTLADLRESGGIENFADVAILLYRSDYYENPERTADNSQDDDGINPAELIVAKNRSGPTGTVNALFDRVYSRFTAPTPVFKPSQPETISRSWGDHDDYNSQP